MLPPGPHPPTAASVIPAAIVAGGSGLPLSPSGSAACQAATQRVWQPGEPMNMVQQGVGAWCREGVPTFVWYSKGRGMPPYTM